MRIKGIKGLTIGQLQDEIAIGGLFVTYTYCFSFVMLSFKKSSAVYFIRSNENAFVKGLPFNLVSLLFGWWGIPWGPLYTITSLFQNINGGSNVTAAAMQYLQQATKGHVFEFEPQAACAFS